MEDNMIDPNATPASTNGDEAVMPAAPMDDAAVAPLDEEAEEMEPGPSESSDDGEDTGDMA